MESMTKDGRDMMLRGRYARFVVMILTSTVVMYLLTYTNVFDFAHIRVSTERVYMALIMGSAMAIVMMGFMWQMYPNIRLNAAIMGGAAVFGIMAFLGSQTQAFIGDVAYMNGMIPHHSIAILTSERAGIEDLRVRVLAQGIRDTQVREIKEMTWLINDIVARGLAINQQDAAARPVPDFGSN